MYIVHSLIPGRGRKYTLEIRFSKKYSKILFCEKKPKNISKEKLFSFLNSFMHKIHYANKDRVWLLGGLLIYCKYCMKKSLSNKGEKSTYLYSLGIFLATCIVDVLNKFFFC